MTNEEKSLNILKKAGGPFCDDCLALEACFSRRQTANSICRDLHNRGQIKRTNGNCHACRKYKIVNEYLTDKTSRLFEKALKKEKLEPDFRPWYWEGNIQSVLVSWLVRQGYTIRKVSDTAARTQGKDIIAVDSSDKEHWISVKGYPERSPNVQARHWFSDALMSLTLYRDEDSSVNLGLALPDGFATYINLAPRIEWLRRAMPFTIYWVSEGGHVRVE